MRVGMDGHKVVYLELQYARHYNIKVSTLGVFKFMLDQIAKQYLAQVSGYAMCTKLHLQTI